MKPSPVVAPQAPGSDAQLLEHGVAGAQAYLGQFLDVRRDEVRLPDGCLAQREYIVHPGAVMIVPLHMANKSSCIMADAMIALILPPPSS